MVTQTARSSENWYLNFKIKRASVNEAAVYP